jgi:hypothetical protein
VSRLRIAGLALLAGSVLSFALHFAGVPEGVYRWGYQRLVDLHLNIPGHPSHGTVLAVEITSLTGAILEAVSGVVVLVADVLRRRREPRPSA